MINSYFTKKIPFSLTYDSKTPYLSLNIIKIILFSPKLGSKLRMMDIGVFTLL